MNSEQQFEEIMKVIGPMNQRPVRVPPISNASTATNSNDSTASTSASTTAENSAAMLISFEKRKITGAASNDEQCYSSGVSPGDIDKYESFVRIEHPASVVP